MILDCRGYNWLLSLLNHLEVGFLQVGVADYRRIVLEVVLFVDRVEVEFLSRGIPHLEFLKPGGRL